MIIDDKVCSINYPGGCMVVALDRFFPAEKSRLKKFFQKVVYRSTDEDPLRIAEEILMWLEEFLRAKDTETVLREYANAAVSAKTKAGEMQEGIDKKAALVESLTAFLKTLPRDQKPPVREKLKAEKENLKILKDSQKGYMSKYRFCKMEFNKAKDLDKRIWDNIAMIREIIAEWGG